MKLKSVAELSRLNASFETIVIPNGVHTVEDVERECNCVGNQQKWDTFVKERSRGNDDVPVLP